MLADQALAQKQYAAAQAKYQEAGKLFRTDAVLIGLRRVEAARAADKQRLQAEADKSARIKQLLAEGKTALTGKDYAKAVLAYQQAKKLAPDNLEVLAGLTQAEEARTKVAAARQAADLAAQRDNDFQKAMLAGQKALSAKNYKEAVLAYQQAAKIKPNDAQVTVQLEIAQRELRRAATTTKDEPKKKEEPKKKDDPKKKKEEASVPPATFQELIQSGQKALQAKKYDDAVKAFSDAQKLRPNDAATAKLLKQAQKLQSDTKSADPKKKMGSLTPDDRFEHDLFTVSRSQNDFAIRIEKTDVWDEHRKRRNIEPLDYGLAGLTIRNS